MFSVDVRRTAQACVFALRGELDYDSAVQLQEAADLVLTGPDQPGLVVVDCTALAFCDSSGIGGLIRIYQKLSAHGGLLRLAAAPGSVARVFALTGLDQAIAVHPTPESALLSGAGPRESGSEAAAPPARRASERSTGR
ncbi:STAS domain-containing protein [Streptomyces sp. NPDC059999]|uniref:STAS domain-containing protein n=1 Tax=unclassified Streptomyces TaxID=2593676 RepID=UPI002E3276D5|nr:STAS domain-containing protein [Streptomyces sp. NBC_01426]